MEETRQTGENSSPAYEHDSASTSSRFLFESFDGMFYLAQYGNHPLMERNDLFESSLESISEENYFTQKRRVFQLCEGILSSTKENPFQFASKQKTDKKKARAALAFVSKNYSSLRESQLSSPFLVYTKSTDYSSSVNQRGDLANEIAALEDVAQVVSHTQNRGRKLLSASKHCVEGEKVTDAMPEKEIKEDFFDGQDAKQEKESYWERRRKNNASAKKSRDARKARELQTQVKAAFLQRENLRILAQLMIVQQENASLKRFFYAKIP